MNGDRQAYWLKILCLLLVIHCLLLAGLLFNTLPGAPQLTIFQRAINDAAASSRQRIVNTLFALNDANTDLRWREHQGERQVKVVTWMAQHVFDEYYAGKTEILAPAEDQTSIWVTLVPQVQDFCQALQLDNPGFRLQQYLGLNPNRNYDRFVEFWVNPDDIFRPCADPEPSDNRCDIQMNSKQPPHVNGISNYADWFERLQRSSYRPQGAPWTRMGYTYDWHFGQFGVGASEYIISPHARLVIAGSHSTKTYCEKSG